jgi:integrase/recombinase XerC
LVDFFISYLVNERRLSPHTVKAYQTDLNQTETFLLTHHSISELKQASTLTLRAWVASLASEGLDHRSINRKIASLRSFFKFLVIKNKIADDPTKNLKSLKTKKTLPVYLEEIDFQNLFSLNPFENNFQGLRDRLILELFYGTGIRLSELIGLKCQSVDLMGKKITVLGKRNKYRIIPLLEVELNLIQDYLLERNKLFGKNNLSFLLTDNGAELYPMFVQRKVKKYLEYVSTITKKSPHIIRHSFATHLLNRGADLNAIKELLGHSSLAATQIYTHNTITELKDIHKRSHPKA